MLFEQSAVLAEFREGRIGRALFISNGLLWFESCLLARY